jgi:hypothetical protein
VTSVKRNESNERKDVSETKRTAERVQFCCAVVGNRTRIVGGGGCRCCTTTTTSVVGPLFYHLREPGEDITGRNYPDRACRKRTDGLVHRPLILFFGKVNTPAYKKQSERDDKQSSNGTAKLYSKLENKRIEIRILIYFLKKLVIDLILPSFFIFFASRKAFLISFCSFLA